MYTPHPLLFHSHCCYVTTAHTAWLELGMRIWQLAPSRVLNRQCSVVLVAGFSTRRRFPQVVQGVCGVFWELKVFHLNREMLHEQGHCHKRDRAWAKPRLSKDSDSRFTLSCIGEELRPKVWAQNLVLHLYIRVHCTTLSLWWDAPLLSVPVLRFVSDKCHWYHQDIILYEAY